jgi:hypothetical protein
MATDKHLLRKGGLVSKWSAIMDFFAPIPFFVLLEKFRFNKIENCQAIGDWVFRLANTRKKDEKNVLHIKNY